MRSKKQVSTLQCRLSFASEEDRGEVLSLMRQFSSCERYAYQRLLEGADRKELKRTLAELFGLNTRYADEAILKAAEVKSSLEELGHSTRKVYFGGKRIFKLLQRRHLNGADRKKYLRQWRENRQGTLYSRGDKSKQGNLNLRFVWIDGELYLRVNVGKRKYVYAKVHRKVQYGRGLRDKWTLFVLDLVQAEVSGRWFPYSVELKLKNGKVYAFVSFEERLPEPEITTSFGAVGIDINASPFHLAWAEASPDGNLADHGKLDLSALLWKSTTERDHLLWKAAYKIVELARNKGRAIVMEDIKRIGKGRRGDGAAKLRRRFQQFIYRGLLERIERLARRHKIEVKKVSPAWSSVIGELKYAPRYLLDKDQAAAFVIARRGLGDRDAVPENYLRLLSDKEFIEYGIFRWEQERAQIKEKAKEEKNPWIKKRLNREIRQATQQIKRLRMRLEMLKSSGSRPGGPKGTARGKKSPEGKPHSGQFLWRVLRAALTVPLLGKSFVRDFSPLRGVLLSGTWEWAVSRPVPVPGAGAMSVPNTASRGWDTLKGGTQIPRLQTTVVQSG